MGTLKSILMSSWLNVWVWLGGVLSNGLMESVFMGRSVCRCILRMCDFGILDCGLIANRMLICKIGKYKMMSLVDIDNWFTVHSWSRSYKVVDYVFVKFMAVGWWNMLLCKDKVYVFRLLECVVVGWCAVRAANCRWWVVEF